MFGIGGILLYTFTSCYDKIERHVSNIQFKASTKEYRYLSIHILEVPWQSTSSEHMARFQCHEYSAYSQNGIKFLNGSAKNREGSKTPRYSKPNIDRFCSGWIHLPIHEYITVTPMTPASLCFLIMPSSSGIWLSSRQGLLNSVVILSAPVVLLGREGSWFLI
jgi:hypothetical protein